MTTNIRSVQGTSTATSTRRDYQSPRLNVLGDVRSLTEAGSVLGNEQGPIFGMLSCGIMLNPNFDFNMC